MEQRIAIVHENTINMILEQQQKILQILQGKSKKESSDFCSVREAANILGFSEQKVYQMVNEGQLKKKEGMGKTIRIYRSSLI